MLSKEEIENILNKCDTCKLTECIGCDITYTERNQIREYIEQLERTIRTTSKELTHKQDEYCEHYCSIMSEYRFMTEENQKLIEKLETDNKQDTESVKRFEEMRRSCKDDNFYKKSYQTSIHKLNAKRGIRSEILEILKGEEK